MQTNDVLIVGGGLAGLATAADLAEAGARVTVLEKRGGAGRQGVVVAGRRRRRGGERAACLFRLVYASAGADAPGGRVSTISPGRSTPSMWPSRAAGRRTFRFPNLPAPLGGIVAFTGTDLLTWREKLTNCRALIRALADEPARRSSAGTRLSYAEWHRSFGIAPGVLTKWWNPIALSMGFLPAEEMSARPMTTVFHHFARSTHASQVASSTARRPSGCMRRWRTISRRGAGGC